MKKNQTNFHKENIIELMEGLSPFPQDIFVAEQPWLNDYVLPLISIDMGILRKDLQSTIVHMINPIEPFDGLIGEETTEYHNEFCSENWIAFELTQDNKYRFLADENYFELANKAFKSSDVIKKEVEEKFSNYQKVKEKYQITGKLLPWQDNNPQSFLDELGGGDPDYLGNWVETSPIPSAFNMQFDDDAETVLITHKDNKFIFVGCVAGYSYGSGGADGIMMFYEPQSHIVLFTFDWS